MNSKTTLEIMRNFFLSLSLSRMESFEWCYWIEWKLPNVNISVIHNQLDRNVYLIENKME